MLKADHIIEDYCPLCDGIMFTFWLYTPAHRAIARRYMYDPGRWVDIPERMVSYTQCPSDSCCNNLKVRHIKDDENIVEDEAEVAQRIEKIRRIACAAPSLYRLERAAQILCQGLFAKHLPVDHYAKIKKLTEEHKKIVWPDGIQ